MPDAALLRRLSDNSVPYRDPLREVDWSELHLECDWLPEPALSLFGLREYDALSAPARRRLSQYEFVNVMQCGLWLEGLFLKRLTARLQPGLPRAEYEYLLHELREETGHSLMFLRAIETSGLPLPAGAWKAPRFPDFVARHAPAEGGLFWLAAVVAEDVPDKFNRHLRQFGDRLNRAVRQVCTVHVVDEARHLTFARSKLDQVLQNKTRVGRALWAAAATQLLRQLARVFYYPPARFYELAGLTPGNRWRRLALENPERRRFVAQRLAPTLRILEIYRR